MPVKTKQWKCQPSPSSNSSKKCCGLILKQKTNEEVTSSYSRLKKSQRAIADLLEGIEVEKLTLRKARKVAKALDIRQKVRGKDQPKAFLVAQITKKLKANPDEVAPHYCRTGSGCLISAIKVHSRRRLKSINLLIFLLKQRD